MRTLALVASILLLTPGIAQAKSLEDILVEKGVITESEAQAGSHHGAKVYWNEGTRLEFPDTGFSAQINTIVQSRYEFIDGDEDVSIDDTSSFSVHRAKLSVSGHALNKEFSYMLEASFQGQAGAFASEGRGTQLHDAWISWEPCDNGHLKFGQFKPRVVRQWNTHPAKLQFADRSAVGTGFTLLRGQGMEGEWGFNDDRFIIGGQIFNGISDGEGQNSTGVDTDHLGGAYARFAFGGEMDPFAEGDVDWTEEAAFNAGVAYLFGTQNNDFGAGSVETDLQDFSADANFKYKGFSLHGEFLIAEFDNGPFDPGKLEQKGGYVQAGYFLSPKRFEIAGRYGFGDCDGGGNPLGGICSLASVDDINEAGLSLNYFWWKHHLKAQLGYEFLDYDLLSGAGGGDVQENRYLLQVSAWF